MSIVKQVPDKRKTIRLAPDESVWVGIDVHKATYNVSIFSSLRAAPAQSWHMASDNQALLRMLLPIAEHIRMAVYEAGPTGFVLARLLQAHGLLVQVVAPGNVPQSPGRRAKSDRLDADHLAQLAAAGLLEPIYIPTEIQEDERQVFRARDQIRRKLRRVKAQIKALLLMKAIAQPKGLAYWSQASVAQLHRLAMAPGAKLQLELLLDELAHLNNQNKRAEASLKAVIESSHAGACARMRTVMGVGPITAAAMVLELPQLPQLRNRRQVAQLIGLAPLRRASGQSEKQCGRDRQGKKMLRSILIEAAWRWMARDRQAQKIFHRVCKGKKTRRKQAIVAVARRLAIILWRLTIEDRDYQNDEARHGQAA
jgi:transposase